jgi:hypothetical protein
MLVGPNAIHPDKLTAEERLTEIGEILAGVMLRARNRELLANLPTEREPLGQITAPSVPSSHAASNEEPEKIDCAKAWLEIDFPS